MYNTTVLALSIIPGAGWIVGGVALAAEGVSYLTTGQSIADNLNESLDGGTLIEF